MVKIRVTAMTIDGTIEFIILRIRIPNPNPILTLTLTLTLKYFLTGHRGHP
jgi:hypothetical protein